MTACKNCNNNFEGHYCNNCSQDAHTGRLSLHSVWHEVQHALLHLDKGFLYTAKQLFTRPGHSIREFIEGRRIQHFKPLSLVVVLTTILALLFHYFKIEFTRDIGAAAPSDPGAIVTPKQVSEWLTAHFSMATIIFMLFGSVASYLVFIKRGYNFIEHLFINAFITAQHLLVQLAVFPLIYLFKDTQGFVLLSFMLSFVNIALGMWVFMQFFNTQPKVKIFFLALLTYILTIVLVMITAIIAGNLIRLAFHH